MSENAGDDRFWGERTAKMLSRIREVAPQVHVLTSTVAQPFSANLLLAVGAQPSMSAAEGEIDAFAERTDALVANLGMLDATRRDALERALPILEARRCPWVLDPVKVERSPERRAFAQHLISAQPAVIRANADEMAVLDVPAGIVRAVTGAVDRIEADGRRLEIEGGHPLMARVTAMGCAGTGLVAATLAVEADPFAATVGALLALAVAGERAAEVAPGPGSFPAAFLDALHALSAAQLVAGARIR